jgi:LmbE family N-acetylglucosaminyl deacetylase
VAKIREEEAYRAALILGASQVLFLREADGLTFFSKKTKIRLISILRELRPEIVFTHAKSDHFPDHQIVHQLTLSAIVAASGPWYSDAPQTPHRVSKIYGYEVWNPIPQYQLAVDITATLSRKLEALRAHTSQIGNVDYLGAATGLAKYRGVSSMSGDYAEVFEILQDTLL